MVYIYVIKLEQNKYYIGKTDNPNFRLQNHFDSKGSKWTTIYKPLKIIELKQNCDIYDEDKITIQYMNKYGINNVRGGSFVSVKLKNTTMNILKKMIDGANNNCFVCGKNGHFAKDCQENNNYLETDSEEDYLETDSEEEYEIWSCSYCGKEFDSYNGAKFHENVHCKNNKLLKCYRCGRKGHYSSECYASKHINGYYIEYSEY